jgi:hypothetical protein
MNSTSCIYGPNRNETLVAYLYDELGPAERTAFVAHVATCKACEAELVELRDVRQQLAQWASPEQEEGVDSVTLPQWASTPPPSPFRTMMREVPVWAQVAAALLVFGVAAGIANIEVRYDASGLTVRTGWSTAPEASTPAVSQADLAAVEERMRGELAAVQNAAASVATSQGTQIAAAAAEATGDAEAIRRVRSLVAESERRQQRELALRIAELLRDVQAQRASDLQRIDRSLGIIQSSTGVEVMRQRQLLNNLAVRVSQQQ